MATKMIILPIVQVKGHVTVTISAALQKGYLHMDES